MYCQAEGKDFKKGLAHKRDIYPAVPGGCCIPLNSPRTWKIPAARAHGVRYLKISFHKSGSSSLPLEQNWGDLCCRSVILWKRVHWSGHSDTAPREQKEMQ